MLTGRPQGFDHVGDGHRNSSEQRHPPAHDCLRYGARSLVAMLFLPTCKQVGREAGREPTTVVNLVVSGNSSQDCRELVVRDVRTVAKPIEKLPAADVWPDADGPGVGIGSFGTGHCHARLKRLAF